MRRLGLILAALAACLVLFAGGIYARSEMILRRRYPVPRVAIQAATDPARVAHGQHLVATMCSGCHGAD
jgi:mono/diheme cytochrome c family protein